MKIMILNQSGERVERARLLKFMARITQELERELHGRRQALMLQRELVVVFLREREARKFNRQFRQRDYATDVLSFSSVEPSSLGELALCPKVLKRQAREIGFTFTKEVAYMCLHGVLHLLGFDHEKNERQAKRMFALQDRVFEKCWGK